VILPEEVKELTDYGITKIYSPDDGRSMGLQGMINDMIATCDFPTGEIVDFSVADLAKKNPMQLAIAISAAENFSEKHTEFINEIKTASKKSETPVLGITGTGGSGKSSLVDELVRRYLIDFPEKTIAIVSVDPSKRKTGGALWGDSIRINSIKNDRVYMRSLATRQSNLALSKHVSIAVDILKVAGFDMVILETSGIGQSDTEIVEHSNVSLYVMTPEYGAATQLEKIDMIDFADVIALNKFDKRGALDALRDVKKQYQRNHNLWENSVDSMPVYGSIASQFNDPGTNELYQVLIKKINKKTGTHFKSTFEISDKISEKQFIIPPNRVRYLSEITENNRAYNQKAKKQKDVAQKLFGIYKTICSVANISSETNQAHLSKIGINEDEILKIISATLSNRNQNDDTKQFLSLLFKEFARVKMDLNPYNWELILNWEAKKQSYKNEVFTFNVRGKELSIQTHSESLSHTQIPKISLPKYEAWGDLLLWTLEENVPGEFPYTAGLFPFKRTGEDPARMFAGEGGPERTNRRFHYVSLGLPAKRLSTAFDSVTLYGNDPDIRPDIYGKIGNAGVSVCCLDDAKKLYSGFDLTNAMTSVSMTINGPAPMMLAFFMNAAIDQECEKYIVANGLEKETSAKIKAIYQKKGVA
ncbi:MAG: methylmalonyl-CoA mutase family protein, partial [Lutibacter sp.]|nr:methylmalonyl-CoA mutase family protein [Lutibacter sp.]